MNSPDEALTLIEDCEARESRLSDWEREFVESIRNRLEGGMSLTEKQSATLDSIWERATKWG